MKATRKKEVEKEMSLIGRGREEEERGKGWEGRGRKEEVEGEGKGGKGRILLSREQKGFNST